MFTPFAFVQQAVVSPTPIYNYLLDDYSGSVGAFSFRKLSSTYTGSCIAIRRSSDNTTSSIGFVDNILDTGSLLSFVGTGSGYIHTWFNQSNTGSDFRNTTNASQPLLVNSGSIYTLGSYPAALGNENDITYLASIGASRTGSTALFIGKSTGLTGGSVAYALGGTSTNGFGIDVVSGLGITSGSVYYLGNNNVLDYASPGNVYNLSEMYFSSGNSYGYYNNTYVGTNASSANLTFNTIFARSSTFGPMNGYLQEVIVWQPNLSSSRSDISSNINDYYSIY